MRTQPKNTPNRIYLNVGEDIDGADFNELAGVSWCTDKINPDDIEYYNSSDVAPLLEALESHLTNDSHESLTILEQTLTAFKEKFNL